MKTRVIIFFLHLTFQHSLWNNRYIAIMQVQLFTGPGSSSIFALGVKIHNETEDSPSTTAIPLEILQSTRAVIEIEFSKLGNVLFHHI